MSLPHGTKGIRLTVSVPRALWEEAQTACPGMNDSKIVQTALRILVERQRTAFKTLGASPTGMLKWFDR